ncbi:hypothetical protein B0H17DRAFT_1297194 [Mycena rosella]|uniref:Uncharacterized protein n=1 Tax=Mycena rosella TaxID=1033263 RepID=A0AAD7GH55_MYCRO|nr:hypothetical protein B0H17DRAFT_1297194 [Mycena rosella]
MAGFDPRYRRRLAGIHIVRIFAGSMSSPLLLLRAAVLPARRVCPSLHPPSLFRLLKAVPFCYRGVDLRSEPVLRDWVESRPHAALPSIPPADLFRPASAVSREEVVDIDEVKAIVIRPRRLSALGTSSQGLRGGAGLRVFTIIRLQRVVALARFHQLINPAAALHFTSMAMAETCPDYSATHLEVPEMPDFEPAAYEAQQQTGIHFWDL